MVIHNVVIHWREYMR